MILNWGRLVFILLSLVVLSSACNDDDPEPANSMNLSDRNFTVKKAQIVDYGLVGSDVYNLDMVLNSEGLDFSPASQKYSGTGELLYFTLYSSAGTIPTGIYNLKRSESEESRITPNTIDLRYTKFGYDLNGADPSAGFLVTFKSGKVNVSKSGDGKLALSWELLTTEGQTFKGNYDGPSSYVNALKL